MDFVLGDFSAIFVGFGSSAWGSFDASSGSASLIVIEEKCLIIIYYYERLILRARLTSNNRNNLLSITFSACIFSF